jgi:DNA-binding protein Fis
MRLTTEELDTLWQRACAHKDSVKTLLTDLLCGHVGLHEAEQWFRQAYIDAVLTQTGQNRCAAARVLGVHRNTLLRMIGRGSSKRGRRKL